MTWTCALELDPRRRVTAGGFTALADAIGRGADLRIYTEFTYEEHLAPYFPPELQAKREDYGLIQEVIDFRQTFLVDGRHAAGVTTLRQPMQPTIGFNGTQPKMSFFLYNMDGQQACANLLLDGATPTGRPGTRTVTPAPPNVPKMSPEEAFDLNTAGPSRNFIYDMEVYRYFVRDDWSEALAHDEQGRVVRGSWDAITRAQRGGREIKVGVRDLCADLARDHAAAPHEVFSLVGSGFNHTGRRYYETATHPLVRVAPAVPLRYASFNWDVSWVALRTDGVATLRRLDPYTRRFEDRPMRYACRWLVR